jgi:peptidoglycan glycosyltransferase
VPGVALRGGGRVLARARPRPGRAVRTTIDVRAQAAAADALAGRLGGVAAIDPRTSGVRALAGIAFSGPQPPGSTFKVVTTAAALEAGIVRPSSRFPVQTKAVIDGVDLENANGESCGGTFVQSFAHSCNSVFAPLGVRLGARRLVQMAERFGFNRAPTVRGAAPSTLPPAADLRTPLEVGSTAIGQGRVLATSLLMAQAAQTVAAGGVHSDPVLESGGRPPRAPARVMSARTAQLMRRMMVAVVRYGTGTAAALGTGARVAGKTGTAELESTVDPEAPAEEGGDPRADTDAWFIAFAPARRPRIAVAVMLVRAGAGGETAAPAARGVIRAALR